MVTRRKWRRCVFYNCLYNMSRWRVALTTTFCTFRSCRLGPGARQQRPTSMRTSRRRTRDATKRRSPIACFLIAARAWPALCTIAFSCYRGTIRAPHSRGPPPTHPFLGARTLHPTHPGSANVGAGPPPPPTSVAPPHANNGGRSLQVQTK